MCGQVNRAPFDQLGSNTSSNPKVHRYIGIFGSYSLDSSQPRVKPLAITRAGPIAQQRRVPFFFMSGQLSTPTYQHPHKPLMEAVMQSSISRKVLFSTLQLVQIELHTAILATQ